jgi:ribosomal protein S18 acetylase RimI-like enzyme
VTAGVVVRRLVRPDELDVLEPLWLALHRHHRTVIAEDLLVADDAVSWRRRRARYRGWLEDGTGLVLVAEDDGVPVGYAVAHVEEGEEDDTFALGEAHAELYSLSVAPDARGAGIGGTLFGEVERRLAAAGIVDLMVAVMAGNDAARRFYERRGLRPAETVLLRLGEAGRA